jgi:hypothetical protein
LLVLFALDHGHTYVIYRSNAQISCLWLLMHHSLRMHSSTHSELRHRTVKDGRSPSSPVLLPPETEPQMSTGWADARAPRAVWSRRQTETFLPT